jgi:peptide/nickel transport system substrate-binding protein
VRWQVLFIGLGMALAGILLAYLALTYVVREVPTVGGTYIEGVAGTPHYINPLLSAYNEADADVCKLVFNGLTRLNGRGEVEPELAIGWDTAASNEEVRYTFHLRSDVRWHDGEPFTADDVMATIRLLQDPDYPGPPDIGALWRTAEAEKIDDYTVQFTLPNTFAPFLDFTTIGILPAHLFEGVRSADLPNVDFNLRPVGTGPFQLEEVEIVDGAITSILLVRNPDYFRSAAMLENFRLRFYPTHQSVIRAYEDGEIDGVNQVLLEDLPRAYEAEDLELYSAQMSQYALVFLNLSDADLSFFQDRDVRQALMYGLDREQIVESILEGQGLVAHSPVVANTWAYNENITQYTYDPERAAALMDRAGWRVPAGASLRTKPGEPIFAFTLLASTSPLQTAVADEIARQWNQYDIRVTVATTSPLALRDALEQRNFEAALVEISLPGDPDPYPLWHQTQITTGQNYAGFDHRRMSEVLERSRLVVDTTQRQALYDEFQAIYAEEVPAILLYHPFYTYGVNETVKGVQIPPLMYPADRFATVNEWYVAWRRIIISETEAR